MLRFSTETLPKRDRLPQLREAVGRAATNTDIIPLGEDFRVDISRWELPGTSVMTGGNTAHRFEGPFDLGRAEDNFVMLWTEGEGCMRWQQRGADIWMRGGNATLMSGSEKRIGENHAYVSYTTLRLERALLTPLVADPDSLTLRPIAAGTGALQLLKNYIKGVGAAVGDDLQKAMAGHIYDLVALSLGTTRDTAELIKGRGLRAVRLNAVKRLAQQHLGDPAWSINDAARTLGITPRTIQLLFKDDGTTFSAFLQSERLGQAMRALENRHLTIKPIGAIAYDAGFGDLSHFNHMFRRAYGETPSDVRARTLAAPTN